MRKFSCKNVYIALVSLLFLGSFPSEAYATSCAYDRFKIISDSSVGKLYSADAVFVGEVKKVSISHSRPFVSNETVISTVEVKNTFKGKLGKEITLNSSAFDLLARNHKNIGEGSIYLIYANTFDGKEEYHAALTGTCGTPTIKHADKAKLEIASLYFTSFPYQLLRGNIVYWIILFALGSLVILWMKNKRKKKRLKNK